MSGLAFLIIFDWLITQIGQTWLAGFSLSISRMQSLIRPYLKLIHRSVEKKNSSRWNIFFILADFSLFELSLLGIDNACDNLASVCPFYYFLTLKGSIFHRFNKAGFLQIHFKGESVTLHMEPQPQRKVSNDVVE